MEKDLEDLAGFELESHATACVRVCMRVYMCVCICVAVIRASHGMQETIPEPVSPQALTADPEIALRTLQSSSE